MITFKTFLTEGGAFGHLSNIYDINLSFAEMSQFISDTLKGKLDYVEEKTDAVNLLVSYRKDRGIIAARNKSHLKNFGENALDADGIRLKFKDRALENAYGHAMDDLENSIKSLSEKQLDKIFANGKKWLSIEVMGDGAENIIEYGVRELRLHGTIEHNEAGEAIAPIDKEAARIFDGMLRQRGTEKGGTFTIKNLNRVSLPEVDGFSKLNTKFQNELKSIMRTNGLKPTDTISILRDKYWEKIIRGFTNDDKLIRLLVNRWSRFEKIPPITAVKKEWPQYIKEVQLYEKKQSQINKELILPLEKLFLSLGAERIKTMSDFMAINPDETVKKLKQKIDFAIDKIRQSGNVVLINKLEIELDRLQAAGKLLPTEGITFFWKGHFLKLTGSFAPTNQIIGLLYRL